MGEFSEILSVVEQELRASDASLEVIRAFPEKARPNPQRKKLAAIGIEKVSMAPVGLNDYCMGENVSLGKKAEVWVKISFCCNVECCISVLVLGINELFCKVPFTYGIFIGFVRFVSGCKKIEKNI